MSRIGVVLFNLGGPQSLDDIEEFLFNLFMDPYIIEIPLRGAPRRFFARFIARRRAARTKHYYEIMGGRSPQYELTMKQASALEERLRQECDARVYVGMRYFKPYIESAVERIADERIRNVILLPLYPHYSRTTTLSSFEEWNRVAAGRLDGVNIKRVENFHNDPLYIDAVVDRIRTALAKFPAQVITHVHILFSAHGVPVSVIKRGDPYQQQIIETVQLVSSHFTNRHSLSYQSRVGPVKWLGPPTLEEIKRLAREGRDNLLVVPISFVSEHSETLYEVNHLFREEAKAAGIVQFEMMPALNDSPKFIETLAKLVTDKIGEFDKE